MSTANSGTPDPAQIKEALHRVGVSTTDFTSVWKHPFVWIVLVVFAVIFLLTAVLAGLAIKVTWYDRQNYAGALLSMRILLMADVLLVALVMIPIGVVLAWFGIRGDFNASVEGSDVKAKMTTTTPGVLLFVLGSLLMYGVLSAKIEMSEGTTRVYGTNAPPPDTQREKEKE